MELLSYDLKNGTHRSAEEEWMPHKPMGPSAFEWHYITAPLTGENGHHYFLFLCCFNFNASIYRVALKRALSKDLDKNKIPISAGAHLCDYDTDLYKNGYCLAQMTPDTLFHKAENMLYIEAPDYQVEFSYKGDSVKVKAKTDIYECELNCTGGSRVMWMKDTLGKEGFIREGGKRERSFYYSLPELPLTGWLRYTDNDGVEQIVKVSGNGWVDRQWGNFMTKSWEWTSFRFDDRDRINCYNFGNGYQVFTYQKPDGTTVSYPKFCIVQNGYLRTPADSWVSWGWDYYIPVKDGYYRLVPYSDKNIIPNELTTFFEGPSEILDRNGKHVGIAVTESMDVKWMHNGTNDKFNNYPPKSVLSFGDPI